MNRAQMTAVFLATLDELAEAPWFVGGKPGEPTLDCDTVLGILLEQIHNWHDVPYEAIRAMFAGLLSRAPLADVERLLASVSGQLATAEECAAEAAREEAETREQQTRALLDQVEAARVENPDLYGKLIKVIAKTIMSRPEAVAA